MAEEEKKKGSGWINLLVDYGPLLGYFAVYCLYAPVLRTTAKIVPRPSSRSAGA